MLCFGMMLLLVFWNMVGVVFVGVFLWKFRNRL